MVHVCLTIACAITENHYIVLVSHKNKEFIELAWSAVFGNIFGNISRVIFLQVYGPSPKLPTII